MRTTEIVEDKLWSQTAALLPSDMAETARTHRALRRARKVSDAQGLMRMILAYAVADLPMKDVAAWARSQGIATMTAPSFFNRLKHSKDWLSVVLSQLLQRHLDSLTAETAPSDTTAPSNTIKAVGDRLRVADATVITGPAATGAEWRVHTVLDPRSACATYIELTDEHGGEGFARLSLQSGDIVVGDRAYAVARSIASVWQRDCHLVARLNPYTIRLCNLRKEVVAVSTWDPQVPETGIVSYSLLVPVPPEGKGQGAQRNRPKENKTWSTAQASDWIPVRVIASRGRGKKVLWVVTTLPESMADDATVLELYRIRWQVELFFKRLKSLLHLDTLPSKKGPTAQSWIMARLLAAALAQQLLRPVPSFFP